MSRNVFVFFFVLVKFVSKSLGFIVLVKRKEWTGSRLQHSGPQTLNPFVKDQDQTNDKKYGPRPNCIPLPCKRHVVATPHKV